MSFEQIKREFPFLWQAFPPFEDVVSMNMRVSRLSIEALFLPMEEIYDQYSHVFRELYAIDAGGNQIVPDGGISGEIYGKDRSGTVGDFLLNNFWSSAGKDLAEEVCYVVYTDEVAMPVWRRQKGSAKSHREDKIQHFKSVIFKMPKNKTFWQILQAYRREKQMCQGR